MKPSSREKRASARPAPIRLRPREVSPAPLAFSLVELMVVLSVVALLMAFAAPAFVSLNPARKTAAAELAGTLESARARAIALGQEVHVAFADGSFPVAGDRHRAYAFFTADPDAPSVAATEAEGLPALVPVSPWYRLPDGLVFGRSSDFEAVAEVPFRLIQESSRRKRFPVTVRPGVVEEVELPYLSFGARGEVASPGFTEADALHLGVVEGLYEPGSREIRLTRTRPGRSGGSFAQGELVGVAYYTGRATVLTD